MIGNYRFIKKAFSLLIVVLILIPFSSSLLYAGHLFIPRLIMRAIPKVVIQAEAKVVKIYFFNKKGEKVYKGSGFFIEPEKILTCEHIIESAYSIAVENENNYFGQITILKKDENSDLALLKVDDQSKEGFLQLHKEQELNLNQQIVTIGYACDSEKIFTYGSIIKDKMEHGIHEIQTSAPIYRYMHGGPVLNLEGHVIGVNYWARAYKNEYYAIGIKTIKEFLNMPDNPQQLPEAGSAVFYIAFKRAVIEKIGEFFSPIYEFVFFHGRIIGIFIIIFSSILFIFVPISIHNKLCKIFQRIKRKNVDKRIFGFYCWKCGKKMNMDLCEIPISINCKKCKTILPILKKYF